MKLLARVLVLVGSLGAVTGAALAEAPVIPHHQDRPPGPPLSPAEALAKMTVPEGFHVELVASEPDLVNPVAMTFDERGRIWVAESLEYPRRSPGLGRDRVKVLEDTDGDGKVDRTTVFAEGLNIPSGIAVGYGGVWVANAPDILFLQDTDGDGRADRREVVVTGFGRTDTHELPNSLTWGPDGWLYGLNGVFNRSHVKHQGREYRFTCAMFRIHPRTHAFELFAEGTSNPWGIAWDTEGSAFLSACVIDHLWHITESGYYHRQAGAYPPFTWKIGSIVKHKHQKAAYCGITFFDSAAYPEEYRGRLYMGNIHGNCLNVDVLQRKGSTYFATPAPDFLQANDAWFMPVAQKTGPDGCLYVLDWYDRYHCYQDARRDPKGIDRLKGRLYRIRYRDTPRAGKFDLAQESDRQLIERLHSPNVYFRETAQRLLAERNDPETRPKLERLVLDGRAPRKARLHGLWSLIAAGRLHPEFHRRILTHPDATFRAWGVRAAGNFGTVDPAVVSQIENMVDDSSPDVLLQLAIAAGKIDGVDSLRMLVEVLARCGNDPLIPHIVWQNLHPHLEGRSGDFLQIVENNRLADNANVAGIMPRVIERLLARRDFDAEPIAAVLQLLLDAGTAGREPARHCLSLLAERVQSREIAGEALQTIRKRFTPILHGILKSDRDDPLVVETAFLATTWNDAAGIAVVRQALVQPGPVARRLAALDALVAAGDGSLIKAIGQILQNPTDNSADFRGRLIASLGRLDDPQVASVLLENYGELEPELQPRAIELLTQRIPWSKQLLAAVGRNKVPATAINLNQARRLLSTGDAELAEQVRKHWGTVRDGRDPAREKYIAEMKRFLRDTPGDPFAGEKAFQRVCAQCHKIYGEGADVGPDITLNGRNSFEQLLSNVFDPSLVIGAAYRALTVVTTDGRVLTGLPVEDTPQRVVLKIQGGKLERLARDDIEFMKMSEISMMPEQLEKQLKPQEIADLFAYLTLDRPPSDPNARRLPGARDVIPRESTDPDEFAELIAEVAPGFSIKASGEGGVALLKEHRGRSTVVRTHPVSKDRPCVLRGTFEIPAGKRARLILNVSHDSRGDWQLTVRVNGRPVLDTLVGPKTAPTGWAEHAIDLSGFAGETVQIELENAANNWAWEFGYWGRAQVVTE